MDTDLIIIQGELLMIYQNSGTSGEMSNEFTWIIIIFFIFLILLVIHIIYRWYRIYSRKQQYNLPKEPEITLKKIPSPKFKLMVGGTYLFLEKTSADQGQGFKIFKNYLGAGSPGLVITRTLPNSIKTKYNIDNSPIIWLSRSKKGNTITPTNLGKIVDEIKEFTNKNRAAIIIFDGLEYLTVHNEFERVLKFIYSVRDVVAVHDARLIFTLNPKTLAKNNIALISKEIKVLNEH